MNSNSNRSASPPLLHTSQSLTPDADVIEWLTSTKKQHELLPWFESLCRQMVQPLPALMDLLNNAGERGIELNLLRSELQAELGLTNTVKTWTLSKYLQQWPEHIKIYDNYIFALHDPPPPPPPSISRGATPPASEQPMHSFLLMLSELQQTSTDPEHWVNGGTLASAFYRVYKMAQGRNPCLAPLANAKARLQAAREMALKEGYVIASATFLRLTDRGQEEVERLAPSAGSSSNGAAIPQEQQQEQSTSFQFPPPPPPPPNPTATLDALLQQQQRQLEEQQQHSTLLDLIRNNAVASPSGESEAARREAIEEAAVREAEQMAAAAARAVLDPPEPAPPPPPLKQPVAVMPAAAGKGGVTGRGRGGRGGRGGAGRGVLLEQPPTPAVVVAPTPVVPPTPAAASPVRPPPAANDDNECIVCSDADRTHALIPCGHLCLCTACADNFLASRAAREAAGDCLRCPVCRAPCDTAMRVFT